MNITVQNIERLTLDQIREFVEGSRTIGFSAPKGEAVYEFIERVLKTQQYRGLGRGPKGIVRRFLMKMTGLSRAQLTRWISRWMKTRRVKRKPAYRPNFPRRYTVADIALLAGVDAAHEDLSGPAARRVMQREHEVFGKVEYVRLAGISVSHIYNLRGTTAYRTHRVRVHHTQARQVSIGERRKPDPRGRPGYLRVDTVHQGNHDGKAGLFHINAVDTVTQWQVVGCVETICETHLIPVLMAMLHQFPFLILGFHCDNGSEFINRVVAQLLEKLRIEFTKSRAYRTTDNALVEGKNGAVIRKQIGYGAIPAEHAEAFQKFYTAHLNSYLNYHRPCGFATIHNLPRGKRQRRYPVEDYCTPYEKLISLPKWEQYLKAGITAAGLQQQALRMSDTEAAQQMQKAKLALLAKARGGK
jgi:hypothetical protein